MSSSIVKWFGSGVRARPLFPKYDCTVAQLLLGTSGWSYPEWRGIFYPEKFPTDGMLAYYADRFGAVEINNSFYRMPSAVALAKWRDTVPATFRFAFKAPQEITHRKRLKDAEQPTKYFAGLLEAMGERLGPVLFQLPPYQRADMPLLEAFLEMARPLFPRIAFEFRHASWFDAGVLTTLKQFDVSLCSTESDSERQPLAPAKDFVYLRLRKTDYTDDELLAWKRQLQELAESGLDVFCFLKHDVQNVVSAQNLLLSRFVNLATGR